MRRGSSGDAKKSIERQPYLDMLYFPLCKNDLLHLDFKIIHPLNGTRKGGVVVSTIVLLG